MKTKIKTVHEEAYTNGTRILGVLVNYSIDDDWKESFLYVYKEGMYIFFDTIVDMIDYLLYGDTKMKRAYLEEIEFDQYWDSEFIDETFRDKLKWT